MSRKLLVICGKGSVGKTTAIVSSIDLLYKELLSIDPNTRITDRKKYSTRRRRKCLVDDEWAVIESNGKRIGIMSLGDTESGINEGFKNVCVCNYYICASHLYGDTVECFFNGNLLVTFKKNETLFLQKIGDEGNENADNQQFAELIVKTFIGVLWN